MSKIDIEKMIKQYVNKTYPHKVEEYHKQLRQLTLDKLNKYSDIILVNGELMWQDELETKDLKLNALEATRYCKSLHLATKKDWRLPSYDELLTIVNYFRFDPAKIDEIEHIRSNRYWTSSADAADISANWYVDFKYGQTGTALRDIKYNVRCVRDMEKEWEIF